MAGAIGTAASPLLLPELAWADDPSPKPIPGGGLTESVTGVGSLPELFHVYPADGVHEPSSITDFDGVTGWAHHLGTGTGTINGVDQALNFDTDMRFMDGLYNGVDGKTRRGTFGFI